MMAKQLIALLVFVVVGCGMSLDEAMPLLEADVVEITEQFFPDQDYELRLAPIGGDLTGCYYPKVDSYIVGGLGDRDGEELLAEIRDYAEGKSWEVTPIDAESHAGRFEADHPGGTMKFLIFWDGRVYVSGEAGACTRSPRSWTVTRHTPSADS